MPSIIVEVCVDSVLSAQNAVRGGANRLELCGDLTFGGGTTPSIGLLKRVQAVVPDTPIMVMIRPRTGDFLYSDEEFEVMLEDVNIFKKCNVLGFVAGFLTPSGDIDTTRTVRLVCFHRAFDMSNDLERAYTALTSIAGITRVLTSGHKPTAPEALAELEYLLKLKIQLGSKVAILPGSGIKPSTVSDILSLVRHGLDQIHMSGGQWLPRQMTFCREGMGMGEWRHFVCDETAVRSVCGSVVNMTEHE